ncbi:MAG: HAD-IB family hydrolase, partial [Ilumatobacteraceae bacterium]
MAESETSRQGAAFIDLDRTLLAGASGPIFSAALRAAGVIGSTKSPAEDMLYRVFNIVGETFPSMLLARQGVAVMKGRQRHEVISAAAQATDELLKLVQPFAAPVIEFHRNHGRKVVLATTTPHDLVANFARRAGFDSVVATKFKVGPDGSYTGELDGPFAWSGGKLVAVQTWATQHDVSLSESFAYSDSIYDLPLLGAVGHPVAVNPDARLAVIAATRRWPIMNFDVPPGVAKVPIVGTELQRVGLAFARPAMIPFAKFTISGTELIPSSGPVILVGNHRSYFDSMAIAMA